MRTRGWLALAVLCGAAITVVALAAGHDPSAGVTFGAPAELADESNGAEQADHVAQADRGAQVYAFACATCHGATGLGFEEAVAVFPADHQRCTRCHHPQNAAVMPGSQMGMSTMAFSLGEPPPLAELERIARFGTAGALYHYVSAAMPRWAPGSLDDEEYLDVTSHLLRRVGVLAEDETLTLEELGLPLAARSLE